MANPEGAEQGQVAAVDPAAAELPRALPPPTAAALVFVAAGAVLMLEILAVRLLAPYVGLTLETTTSIIGAALGGIALGAAVGGYLADRTDTRRLIVGLLVGGGLLTLLTVPAVRWLGPGARGDGDLAVLGIAVLALVPAAAVLSAVSPAVAHLQLHDLRASGTVVGRLSAWATAGALIGTFGSGFVIVPLMPVGTAVLIIGAVLVLVGLALGAASPLLSPPAVAGLAFVAVALGALSGTSESPCDWETDYHCVSVEADPASSGGYELLLEDARNSYVDLDDPTHLEYSYVRWIADAVNGMSRGRAPLDAVFVGGGAFTLPRWRPATRPGSSARVLEVDGGVVDVVEDELGLRPSADLRTSVGDARMTMLDVESGSADLVVGDAFSGYTIPWQLTTREWLEEVQRVLRPGGLYALNTIDYPPLDFFEAQARTLLDTFASMRLVAFVKPSGQLVGGNLVLLASDRALAPEVGSIADGAATYSHRAVESLVGDAEPLSDDYAPVDQLRTVG
ncbi:MAG: fused MFS/spermidine synthase [Solirubrobacterales bacterium]